MINMITKYCAATTYACDLYWNPMLCERLSGRTGILLKENGQPIATLSVILVVYRKYF